MGGPNIVLDHELLDQCRKLTGIKTTRALVDYALHELRRLALQKGLMELKGSVIWQSGAKNGIQTISSGSASFYPATQGCYYPQVPHSRSVISTSNP
ncbi:MAG: type II toxin-antitoxin system VapB family antitoxin [Candidatus Sabulitectum sp.]|nr:type II toxin-antitoxin system VapB family antitoxin [Candidatus Sabulitectum sp.]